MTKRIGRFEFDQDWRDFDPQYSRLSVALDHANGDPSVYSFPNLSVEDAQDLAYGLKQFLARVDGKRGLTQ